MHHDVEERDTPAVYTEVFRISYCLIYCEIAGEQVIVLVDCTVVYQADPANRELVTTVETLNYGGKKAPSIIVVIVFS